jgi:hypothetical protein
MTGFAGTVAVGPDVFGLGAGVLAGRDGEIVTGAVIGSLAAAGDIGTTDGGLA